MRVLELDRDIHTNLDFRQYRNALLISLRLIVLELTQKLNLFGIEQND